MSVQVLFAHLWTCEGERCGCWRMQGAVKGRVAQAMMKAENDALAQGLGKTVAQEKAAAAEKAALSIKQRPPKPHETVKMDPAVFAETQKWLHSVL